MRLRCATSLIFAIALAAMPLMAVVRKPPSKHPMRREYVKKTYGKHAIAPVVGGAAVRRSKGSFGQHLASSAEGYAAKNTAQYAVAGIRHEDLHYHRSTKKGFGPRLRHALVSTVVTRKTTTGKKTVAAGHISGAAAAGAVAGGAATGGISLGATAGTNVAREFWPRKKKKTVATLRR
ncbi:MAG TPA: hypothetical protein VG297_18120 [Bryobacteraceae bacterium]|nr:hypothetical protein [Bryobacteraceae bacterium]